MNKEILRIFYLPAATEVMVAVDGKEYFQIVQEDTHKEDEEYACAVSVIPGVSRLKIKAVPDGVEQYYWTYTDEFENVKELAGEGDGNNYCVVKIPENLGDGMTLYIEEGYREVDFGYDYRNMYFRNKKNIL